MAEDCGRHAAASQASGTGKPARVKAWGGAFTYTQVLQLAEAFYYEKDRQVNGKVARAGHRRAFPAQGRPGPVPGLAALAFLRDRERRGASPSAARCA